MVLAVRVDVSHPPLVLLISKRVLITVWLTFLFTSDWLVKRLLLKRTAHSAMYELYVPFPPLQLTAQSRRKFAKFLLYGHRFATSLSDLP